MVYASDPSLINIYEVFVVEPRALFFIESSGRLFDSIWSLKFVSASNCWNCFLLTAFVYFEASAVFCVWDDPSDSLLLHLEAPRLVLLF